MNNNAMVVQREKNHKNDQKVGNKLQCSFLIMSKMLIIFSGIIFWLKYKMKSYVYCECKECIWSMIRSKIYQFKARFCVTFISEVEIIIIEEFMQ